MMHTHPPVFSLLYQKAKLISFICINEKETVFFGHIMERGTWESNVTTGKIRGGPREIMLDGIRQGRGAREIMLD